MFRHIVSNLSDVLAAIGSREWPLALGGHMHTRESISFGSAVRTRFHQAAAVVGPTDNAIPAHFRSNAVSCEEPRDRRW